MSKTGNVENNGPSLHEFLLFYADIYMSSGMKKPFLLQCRWTYQMYYVAVGLWYLKEREILHTTYGYIKQAILDPFWYLIP